MTFEPHPRTLRQETEYAPPTTVDAGAGGFAAFHLMTASEPAPWLQDVEINVPHNDLILHVRIPPEVKV